SYLAATTVACLSFALSCSSLASSSTAGPCLPSWPRNIFRRERVSCQEGDKPLRPTPWGRSDEEIRFGARCRPDGPRAPAVRGGARATRGPRRGAGAERLSHGESRQ